MYGEASRSEAQRHRAGERRQTCGDLYEAAAVECLSRTNVVRQVDCALVDWQRRTKVVSQHYFCRALSALLQSAELGHL